jgi:hypothetical protein
MRIRRLTTASCVSLLALLLLAMPAAAGVSWCRSDPIVVLDGTEVQVWVAMESDYEHLVSGPIQVTIFTPNKVSKETTYLDDGFNGNGEEVRFRHRDKVADDGSFPVEIRVRVPLDNRLLYQEYGLTEIPVLIEVISSDGQVIAIEGSNRVTSASLQVHGTN